MEDGDGVGRVVGFGVACYEVVEGGGVGGGGCYGPCVRRARVVIVGAMHDEAWNVNES